MEKCAESNIFSTLAREKDLAERLRLRYYWRKQALQLLIECTFMLIGGVQELTTLDFPGRLAAVVFAFGCNFRCGYCHNPQFVQCQGETLTSSIPEEVFFKFLEKRKGKLEGVCISGGEPTLQPDILEFARKIKRMGFLVKLDTNGTRSGVLEKMIAEKVVDFFAMDIKTSLSRYGEILAEVKKSKEIIQNSGLPYEFRTTAVKGKHTKEIFEEIGEWLNGAEAYFIQNFRNKKTLAEEYENKEGFSEKELAEFN